MNNEENIRKPISKQKCKKMVATEPKTPDERKIWKTQGLPDHRCGYQEWKDGLCRKHHPDGIAERKASEAKYETERELSRLEYDAERKLKLTQMEGDSLTIENAIVLLVQNGYRVDKPIA